MLGYLGTFEKEAVIIKGEDSEMGEK